MKIKNIWLALFVLFVFGSLLILDLAMSKEAEASTVIDFKQITKDTVWTKQGSPYLITDHLQLNKDATLTIESGVVIEIQNKYTDNPIYIDIYGKLVSKGSPSEKIQITSKQPDSWLIYFYPESFGSNFNNIKANNGLFIGFLGLNITVDNLEISDFENGIVGGSENPWTISTIKFNNLDLKNIHERAIEANGNNIEINNSRIENVSEGEALSLYSSSLWLKNSSILNTGEAAIATHYDFFYPIQEIKISSSTIKTGQGNGLNIGENMRVEINDSEISNFKNRGINIEEGSELLVSRSVISNNASLGLFNGSVSNLAKATQNFWGDESGPHHENKNALGINNAVSDNVDFHPWLFVNPFVNAPIPTSTPTTTPPTASSSSNVAFIPGLQASRLYKDQVLENQLWEPNRNDDVMKLYLNTQGQSVDQGIYTEDIINKTNLGVLDKNIYQTFSENMDKLVQDKTINEWKALPYDWRFDIHDIINNEIKTKNGSYDIISEIEKLAANSQTGKVTIITHSNGGLLAKAIINNLSENNQSNLIDKVIMVAAPEIGTPQAVVGLLHGDEQNLPIVMSKSVARGMGENMISAYNLIPSAAYFKNEPESLIHFDSSVDNVNKLRTYHGNEIDNYSELTDFLLAIRDGRSEPVAENIDAPNVLKSGLLEKSVSTHQKIDTWNSPSNIEVFEIAGWGINTTKGLNYKSKEKCALGLFSCAHVLDRETIKTSDGDGTVVSKSAVVVNKNKRYINLRDYNNDKRTNIKHANIFEVESLEKTIKDIITNQTTLTQDYITKEKPVISGATGVRLSMHSPVDIHVYNNEGLHTGPINNPDPSSDIQFAEEGIPNSSYEIIGESKYIDLTGDDKYEVELDGTGTGAFTFKIEEIVNDQKTGERIFQDIPTTEYMKGEIVINSESASPILNLDIDGDNKNDVLVTAQSSEDSTFDVLTYLQIIKKTIPVLKLDKKTEMQALKRIDSIIKSAQKGKTKNAVKKIQSFTKRINSEDITALLQELLNELEK